MERKQENDKHTTTEVKGKRKNYDLFDGDKENVSRFGACIDTSRSTVAGNGEEEW